MDGFGIAPPRSAMSPKRQRKRAGTDVHQLNNNNSNNNYADSGLSFGDLIPATQAPQSQPNPTPTADDFLNLFSDNNSGPFSAPNAATIAPARARAQTESAAGNYQASDFFFDMPGATTSPSASPQPPQPEAGAASPGTTALQSEKKKKKKKKKNKGRGRSKTLGAEPIRPPEHKAPEPPPNDLDMAAAEAAPRRRMKQIDVLPLLHTGFALDKFKFAGNGKPKRRHFSLTDDNKFLCWEARGAEALAKAADDRQVYLGQIRTIQRNDPADLASLSAIRHKQFTLTIVYVHKGGEKTLNIMASNAFHYQLIGEGIEKLVAATNESGRDLADIFELYLNFDKEILPDHLKPQRFKWEALGPDQLDRPPQATDTNEREAELRFGGPTRNAAQSFS